MAARYYILERELSQGVVVKVWQNGSKWHVSQLARFFFYSKNLFHVHFTIECVIPFSDRTHISVPSTAL